MDHSEILPRLAAYHDGQLDADLRQTVAAHVEHCPECQLRLRDWQALDSALATLPVPEGPVQMHRDIREALGKALPPASPRRLPVRYTLAAAAVIVLAFAGALLWRSDPVVEVVETPPVPQADGQSAEEARNESAPRADAAGERFVEAAAPNEVARRSLNESSGAVGLTGAGDLDRAQVPTASVPVVTGETGIPQLADWPARLNDAEYACLAALPGKLKFRVARYVAPLEVAEINLVPHFDDAFVAIGYRALSEPLHPGHEAAYSDPVLLTPETAYLVSNLRLEQTSIWARSQDQAPNAETAIKLAEITWRLANLTADRDDVKGAIAAHHQASLYRPDWAKAAAARLEALRALDKP